MSFMEDHPEWYGTYSDYHPEIARQKKKYIFRANVV